MMKKDHTEEAARAHSTLNTFAAIVALLESGLVYCPEAYKAADRITKIAKDEQQRMLRRYDREIALARRDIKKPD